MFPGWKLTILIACQDVVKKPKLDNHFYKCHSSFTCVDCSTTFNGPRDWKNHTQCISEAEKYQKSLYKGKKNVRYHDHASNGTVNNEVAAEWNKWS